MRRAAVSWLTARPIAHRGLHSTASDRVENTLSAFAAAIDGGFAIECDVMLSADDEPIVFHDDRLDRLTLANGRVVGLTLAELKSVRFRSGRDRIPTLRELLALVAGRVPIFIELKSRYPDRGSLAPNIANILETYSGPLAAMSFDPQPLVELRHRVPSTPRGMIADRFAAADWPELTALKRFNLRHFLSVPWVAPSFIACDIGSLPATAPALLRAFGIPVLGWTVRTAAERARFLKHGDQIIFEGFDPEGA